MTIRRRLIALTVAIGITCAGLTLPTPPSSAQPRPALVSGWQQRMLQSVNAVRASFGAMPLRLCQSLALSATQYAQSMARTGAFGHIGLDGSEPAERMAAAGYRGTVMGENIGAGQRTVVQVKRQLRASPGHLAVMTDRRFHHVGFGHAPGRGRGPTGYWAQNFGAGGSCR